LLTVGKLNTGRCMLIMASQHTLQHATTLLKLYCVIYSQSLLI